MVGSPALSPVEKKWLYFFIALAVLVNLSGLLVTLMVPDAAVYATLSKNMVLRNNYLELFLKGEDWLDKPHFPFWITAAFFKVFGIHTWSYKLPGILFVFAGAWYTYRFARELYNEKIALWSVIIFLTAEHIILSNNDVRAEPFLTGLIIAGIYHFYKAIQPRHFGHLVAASFFAACAVMTKGIFALIPIAGAVGGELILKQQWKQLFNLKWIMSAVLILLFITPELYSLWYQFDSHPEKIVFGRTGVSGIRFFFWDSQFGRFFNTGPIKGSGDKFFFLHTLLWAFLPWCLLMYAGLFQKIKSLFTKQAIQQQEYFTLSGSLLTLLVFSLSSFQLPHYTNIIFPLLAIITAGYIEFVWQKKSKFLLISQYAIMVILLLLGIGVHLLYQPAIHSAGLIIILFMLVVFFFLLPRWLHTGRHALAVYRSVLAILIVNLYLNWIFYPDLLHYQSNSEAAFYINRQYPKKNITGLDPVPNAMPFYLHSNYINRDTSTLVPPQKLASATELWYVSEEQRAFLDRKGYRYTVIRAWDHFPVTRLDLQFVNKATRPQALKKYFLIRMNDHALN